MGPPTGRGLIHIDDRRMVAERHRRNERELEPCQPPDTRSNRRPGWGFAVGEVAGLLVLGPLQPVSRISPRIAIRLMF